LPSRSRSPERVSFANINEALPLPDLIAIQRDSFQWFLDKGLAEAYHDISPIEDFTGQLSLELEFDPTDADLRPPPKFSVEECKEKDMTYAAPVFVRARFLNATTGEIKEQTVFMGDFPMMTDRGTFIVNGTERVVVSQLVRSPGVIFQPGRDAKTVFTGTIHPYRGEWIELDIEAKPGKDVTAGCRVARKRRLSLFVLLRALGYEDPAFLERFVPAFGDLASGDEESLFVDGTARLFEAAKIDDTTHVNELIDLLERRVALLQVLRSALAEPGVYVRIGHENELPAMHSLALVATGYGCGEESSTARSTVAISTPPFTAPTTEPSPDTIAKRSSGLTS